MIKLIAFDLDGTAIRSDFSLSEENRRALERAGEMGLELVPATGRLKSFIPKFVTDVQYIKYAVTANGASVWNIRSGEKLCENLLSLKKTAQVQRLLDGYDIFEEYYVNGQAVTVRGYPERCRLGEFNFPPERFIFLTKDYKFVDSFMDIPEKGEKPEKINLTYLPPHIKKELIEKLSALGGVKLTSSVENNLEINAEGADKGSGLLSLCGKLGIDMCDVMAFGDNGNDVAMLEAAGVSIAVANASPEAKAAAKYETLSCDENGLAAAIDKFVLGI